MKENRMIIVDGNAYQWRFGDSFDDDKKYYYLIIIPEKNLKKEIFIRFFCQKNQETKYLLKEGFLTVKDQQKIILNLNRPKFIAELIYFLIHDKELDFTKTKRYTFDNGIEILKKMGYHFET